MKQLLAEFGAWFYMPVSNGMGNHGIPDIICSYKGWFIGIECKAPGGRLSDLQRVTHIYMQQKGGALIFVVSGHTPEALMPLRAALTMLSHR